MGITIDQLLSEWRKHEEPDGNGMTTEQIAEATEISPNAVRRMLRKGIDDGRIRAGSERRTTPMRPGWHFHANVFWVVE